MATATATTNPTWFKNGVAKVKRTGVVNAPFEWIAIGPDGQPVKKADGNYEYFPTEQAAWAFLEQERDFDKAVDKAYAADVAETEAEIARTGLEPFVK
jgi:hypothetical protein